MALEVLTTRSRLMRNDAPARTSEMPPLATNAADAGALVDERVGADGGAVADGDVGAERGGDADADVVAEGHAGADDRAAADLDAAAERDGCEEEAPLEDKVAG